MNVNNVTPLRLYVNNQQFYNPQDRVTNSVYHNLKLLRMEWKGETMARAFDARSKDLQNFPVLLWYEFLTWLRALTAQTCLT